MAELEKGQMEKMNRNQRRSDKIRLIPAFLLLLSFITHDSQLFIYKFSLSLAIVALFGIFYLIIGLLYIVGFKYSPHLGSTIPALGAALGIYRFLVIAPNPFSVFNVCLDALVVPFSIIIIKRWSK
ncbi:MAG: hypothetical protein RXN81_00290 [Caldisphaera sp.]|jgi:hypothetical protein